MTTYGICAVKVLLVGNKSYRFLKSDGSTTHLRIHANTWTEAAAHEVATHIVADNPEKVLDAKVVVFA